MTEPTTRSETIRLAAYKPHPRNYNRHPKQQIERIAQSLQKFGQIRNVVVWREYFLAGHGVAEAAQGLGWETLEANILPNEYPEHLALGYLAADNELGRQSDPDQAALAAILEELRELDPELLPALGFSAQEAEKLLSHFGEKQVLEDPGPALDRLGELQQKWQTESGQLWELGEHRLLCGDATDEATVRRLLHGEPPVLMVTDPPYGVEYDPSWRADAGINQNTGKLGTVVNDDRVDWSAAYQLSQAQVCYIWNAGKYSEEVARGIRECGYGIVAQIIWVKDRFALSRGDYHWQHEPCWYAVREGETHNWQGARDQSTV